MDRSRKRILLAVVIVVFAFIVFSCFMQPKGPYRIGVVYPLSGPDDVDARTVIEWAAEEINDKGGINGRLIEVVYSDSAEGNALELAGELAGDPSIDVVVGPEKSSEVVEIAPLFIEKRKLLISPSSTAGDIYRMYGGKGFFWRTSQSDVAQIRALMDELGKRGARNVSLIYEDTVYGKTFRDWIGFFGIEYGIDVLHHSVFEPSGNVSKAVEEALDGNPEWLIGAAMTEDAVAIVRETGDRDTKIMFTDAAESVYLIEELGNASLGIEVSSPSADPGAGFPDAFNERFGYYPYDYGATVYDAFLLGVYALARHESQKVLFFHTESLDESMKKVVSGRGKRLAWNESAEAIVLLSKGSLPDVDGASGPLEYDAEKGVDPLKTYYALNRVEDRDGSPGFWTIKTVASDEQSAGALEGNRSVASTRASLEYMASVNGTIGHDIEERKDLWAVIISTSEGWENYRHQADALAMYSLLKANGLDDGHIILMSVDDVPWAKENPERGDVHHRPEGTNLRKDAAIDYLGEKASLDNLRNVMLGNMTEETPTVLESDTGSNVLLYIVDHGAPGYVPFEYGGLLGSEEFASLVEEMHDRGKFRRMFVMVEACFGESLGLQMETPGVVYLTGASKTESSFGAVYDPRIRQWLSDDFTNHVIDTLKEDPGITLEDLYEGTYREVIGSHVRLLNYGNFGGRDTPMNEFTTP